MARGWVKRNFGWIADDFRRALIQLQQPETWMVLVVMAIFGLVIYLGFGLAVKTDATARFLKHQIAVCTSLSDFEIIVMFSGTLFFAFSMVVTLGEMKRYIDFRRRFGHYQATQSARHAVAWGVFALALGLTLTYILQRHCP